MDIEINLNQMLDMSILQKQMDAYSRIIYRKAQTFVDKLAEKGIEVAKSNADENLIIFTKKSTSSKRLCKAMVIAKDKRKIISTWKWADGTIKSAEVSPLLMAEFGSGFKAQNPMGVAGVGQGTFPGQKHAFDIGGWSWMDEDGKWHHSTGETPTLPMYKAWMQMKNEINNIAREVFSND